jgi:MFS family permease
MASSQIKKDLQFWKFSLYGFLKNLQFFDPFLVLFFREMGISFFQIGVLYSVRELATNITEIPTGIVADTLGRRTAMICAFLSYIISFIIFYLFPGFSFYAIAMIAFALGESFRSGTHKAMIMEYLKRNGMAEQKVEYYGHTRGWSQKGSALSALIAALLVFFSGSYRVVFLWSIVPYVAAMGLILTYPKELDFSCDDDAECADRRSRGRVEMMKQTVTDFFSMFRDPMVRQALLNSSLFDASFKTVKDYVQPILKGLALTLPLFASLEGNQRVALISGIVYMVLYLLTSMASSRSGRFHNRFSQKYGGLNATFLCSVGAMLMVGIFLLFGLKVAAIIVFIFYYMLENVRRPASLGLLSDRIKNSVMATGLSGESQLKTILVAIFSPLFGLTADRLGIGYAMLFLGLISGLAYPALRFRKVDRRSA